MNVELLRLMLAIINAGLKDVPVEIGNLRRLEGLQMEGAELPDTLAQLYAVNPLLLVQVHNTTLTSLDLSSIGLTEFPALLVGGCPCFVRCCDRLMTHA